MEEQRNNSNIHSDHCTGFEKQKLANVEPPHPDCLLICEDLTGAPITASANCRLLVYSGRLWGTAKSLCPEELHCSAFQPVSDGVLEGGDQCELQHRQSVLLLGVGAQGSG